MTLLVSKQDEIDESLTYMAGVCQRDRDIWVQLQLEKGTYVIFVILVFFVTMVGKG